ncbi:DUF2769 domain-containing protein [Methanoregula sp.]|uniref:DUF2769 domain-containing protein n=1 Tax=Methanoregula sp. TaxID=2052170 RepID=UPI0035639313
MPYRKKTALKNGSGCICEPCPSYTECMRAGESILFCVKGKTKDCMFDRKGCLCPSCPEQPADRREVYYCSSGTGPHSR